MRGLFPFLRELFFGPAEPVCGLSHCDNTRDPRCKALLCRHHCGFTLLCAGECLRPRTPEEQEVEKLRRMWDGK